MRRKSAAFGSYQGTGVIPDPLHVETTQSFRASQNSLKVVARFRPICDIELEWCAAEQLLCQFDKENCVVVSNGTDKNAFTFSHVFSPNSTQAEVFAAIGKPVIEDVLEGYNGTVFAYGQTGSGKTYTMMGLDIRDEELRGLVPRSVEKIFEGINDADSSIEFTLKCSVLEIYKEKVKDLLEGSGKNLKIKESVTKGIYVDELTSLVPFHLVRGIR